MADDFTRTWVDFTDNLDAEAMNDMEDRMEARVSGNIGGGIELGYASSTTGFTTTSTATNGVDVTGLAVTVVVAARPIIVKVRASSWNVSGSPLGGGVYLNEDGATTNSGLLAGFVGPHSGTGDDPGDVYVPLNGERRLAPAAGTHIYKIRAKNVSAGTLSISAGDGTGNNNSPMSIQVIEV